MGTFFLALLLLASGAAFGRGISLADCDLGCGQLGSPLDFGIVSECAFSEEDVKNAAAGTLWDVIKAEKEFLYFRCAISYLGLESLFNGESEDKENMTAFIPTNEAFRMLPRDVIRRLMRPEFREDLVGTLKYHVCVPLS